MAAGGSGTSRSIYRYTDGENDYVFSFQDDELVGRGENELRSIPKDSLIFATVFQFFYLRLAIFFGCVGIFTNLFRGEMLDKSLHFYLLAPIRREVLLVGKYLAGLIATVVIFTTSTALQLLAMGWHLTGPAMTEYLQRSGMGADRRVPGRDGAGMPRVWKRVSGGGIVVPQSDHSGGGGAAVGERESVSARGAQKDQRDFLFAIDVPGGGAARTSECRRRWRCWFLRLAADAPRRWRSGDCSRLRGWCWSLASLRARKLEINYGTD